MDNSEKNLTFAARLILENMRRENKTDLKVWEAQTAATLFEKALQLNPDNDDLKVGLGKLLCLWPGNDRRCTTNNEGNSAIVQVVQKDSNNMQAQLVLGIGAVISNQYDKAIERLNKVVILILIILKQFPGWQMPMLQQAIKKMP